MTSSSSFPFLGPQLGSGLFGWQTTAYVGAGFKPAHPGCLENKPTPACTHSLCKETEAASDSGLPAKRAYPIGEGCPRTKWKWLSPEPTYARL